MSDRRAFMVGGMLAGVMGGFAGPAVAARRAAFFDRTGLPIGLQMYTLGQDVARNLDAAFTAVAALGYRDIELPHLFGKPVADVAAAARRAGLTISSLHLPAGNWGPTALSFDDSPQKIADNVLALGARHVVLPLAPLPQKFAVRPGETPGGAISRSLRAGGADVWKGVAAYLNERASALKPMGVTVGYHNHNVEFAPIGDVTGWDILVEQCDRALVDFEIDIGWVTSAGLDPVAFLRPLRGRVSRMHVKDVAATTRANFDLSMDPAEVGSGKLDWASILPAAYKAGIRHFYVEQEPPFKIPVMDAVRIAHDYLKALRA
ncbi:MAG TPA: sugar phosphate isomerase/epimerase [Sphingobium sp.]